MLPLGESFMYTSIFGGLRLETKRERVEIDEVPHDGEQSSPKKEKSS
jgi:hypothetical protein